MVTSPDLQRRALRRSIVAAIVLTLFFTIFTWIREDSIEQAIYTAVACIVCSSVAIGLTLLIRRDDKQE